MRPRSPQLCSPPIRSQRLRKTWMWSDEWKELAVELKPMRRKSRRAVFAAVREAGAALSVTAVRTLMHRTYSTTLYCPNYFSRRNESRSKRHTLILYSGLAKITTSTRQSSAALGSVTHIHTAHQ